MATGMTMIEVAYDDLVPAEDNVREQIDDVDDLAASILATGLQQPLKVQATGEGKYLIVAGHRRHAAIGKLRTEHRAWNGRPVPCVVNGKYEDEDRVAAMLVENLQRRDLNPMEEAYAFSRLRREFGWKPADIGARIGRSPEYVSIRLRFVNLPSLAKDRLRAGTLPLATASALAQIKNGDAVTKMLAGTRVPSSWEISDEVNSEKVDVLIDKFTKKFTDLGMEIADERPPFYKQVYFEADDPNKVTLFEGGAPKTAKAYLAVNRRADTVTALIACPLTDKEIAKQQDADAAERRKKAEAYNAEQREKQKAAEAEWTPEFRAFKKAEAEHVATCAALDDEYDEAKRVALLRWAKGKPAKDVARLAMVQLVREMADIEELAMLFDIEASSWSERETAVHEHLTAKAENLLAAVAFTLGTYAEERDVVIHGVPIPEYPLAPTMAGTDPSSEESAASGDDEESDD